MGYKVSEVVMLSDRDFRVTCLLTAFSNTCRLQSTAPTNVHTISQTERPMNILKSAFDIRN